MAEIIRAASNEQLSQARSLFREYQAELPLQLCFGSFETELSGLPGAYAPPKGALLLATISGQPVGCVGLRPFRVRRACEMKRLYVRPPFRGGKVGKELVLHVLQEAQRLGYHAIRLDTHPPSMHSAVTLYRRLGFHQVIPEDSERVEGLLYMELDLATAPLFRDHSALASDVRNTPAVTAE